MNSVFAGIYLATQQLLKEHAPFIKHTDQDLGQLKSVRPPVAWPCVLIDTETFEFESLGENVQVGNGVIVFRLGFAPYSNSAGATPGTSKELALGYYEMEHQLHQLLQGWQPGSHTGKLNRISVTTQKRNDNYRVREMRYSLAFEDRSTQNGRELKAATIDLEVTV